MSRTLSLACMLPLLAACTQPDGIDESTYTPTVEDAAVIAHSQPLAREFTTALQAQLGAAMADGGPVAAVGVCRDEAPRIAAALAHESGAQITRISDRNRNPDGAVSADVAPFYAELAAQPLADGAPATRIWQSGEGDDARINYLSAIPMQDQPCSTCHGSNIDPALQARIAELYPDDLATGFTPGELRGALHISWSIGVFFD